MSHHRFARLAIGQRSVWFVMLVLVASLLVPGVLSRSIPVIAQTQELCDVGATEQFTDVKASDYAAQYILCMRALELAVGTGGGDYSPDRELNRAEMATLLVRLWQDVLGRDCLEGETPFTDIDGNTHEANIECLYNLGITVGVSPTSFGPREPLKASQISRFLARIYDRAGGDCSVVGARELEQAVECLVELRVIPNHSEGTSADKVTRDQMAVYLIGLWYNLAGPGQPPRPPAKPVPSPPITTTTTTLPPDPTGAYKGDPLQLIAHASLGRTYSLPGSEGDVLEVWLCNTPASSNWYSTDPDNRHNPSNYAHKFRSQVASYFNWLSGGNYEPVFRSGGVVEVDRASDYYDACWDAVFAQDLKRWTGVDGVVVVVGAPVAFDNIVGLASCGLYSKRSFPDNRRAIMVNGDAFVDPTVLAHEVGHALCWPHSYSGQTEARNGGIWEYDNPMDIMGSPATGGSDSVPHIGTIAINRYAAGWIPTSQVEIHEPGTTKRYELHPIGSEGTQLLIVPYNLGHRTNYRALGTRVREPGDLWWADKDIATEGVEIYHIGQTAGFCDLPDRGFCYGLDRRTRPIFDSDDGYHKENTAHVMEVGRWWRWGPSANQPGTKIEVINRTGNTFTVEVTPYEEDDTFGAWEYYDWVDEWDDTEVVRYALYSEDSRDDEAADRINFRCWGSDFDSYIVTDTLVLGDFRNNNRIWVNYRAGDAELVAEYWKAWDDDKLHPPAEDIERAVARNIADNPGRFLFRWQNAGSSDWNVLRFADTTGLREALSTLSCY